MRIRYRGRRRGKRGRGVESVLVQEWLVPRRQERGRPSLSKDEAGQSGLEREMTVSSRRGRSVGMIERSTGGEMVLSSSNG
jgi:hypothetical protein